MSNTQIGITLLVAAIVAGIVWFVRNNSHKNESTGTGTGGGLPGKKQKQK